MRSAEIGEGRKKGAVGELCEQELGGREGSAAEGVIREARSKGGWGKMRNRVRRG